VSTSELYGDERISLFIPQTCFEPLAKKQIERLLNPSIADVELVYHELV